MSNFNRVAAGRQVSLTGAELPNQPELQDLLVAMHSVLSQLQTGELVTFKPVRRAVRAKTAYGMTGDGKSHFWARQNPADPAWDPTFPASFKLGDSPRSATVWFADEIEAWLEARANACRKAAQPVPKYGRWKLPSTKADIAAGVTL
jgi:predicted DNA-binding transcriptional regulator AlpA